MVSVNVSQLLLAGLGTVRDFEYAEPFPDPAGELHLRGPIEGHARLTRTSEGILVHSEYSVPVTLECARCLEESSATISGALDEEFFPRTDIRTGSALDVPPVEDDEQLLIDEHHEIDLDEVLRQNILTNLPLRPLCSPQCPGLCPTCGQRLEPGHAEHPEAEQPPKEEEEEEEPVDPASPFARLAVLLQNDQER
jgi:uncharacterized protein